MEVFYDIIFIYIASYDSHGHVSRSECSMRIDNSTFKREEESKYLGTTLTNRNSIPEEIKSRLRSGNSC